ncbi:hypothetical protein M2R47_09170 [Moraxella sp. Tifton1]|uniref:hypothetical protein n=1 Tax=Moraxella oculi TaxID=2940516 RepID=UPI0020127E7E|nr:hypothetical protein [Moraxella sp. Tifton1]MCL1624396.1 hypothetical protein [Moraxella sp. Tifton1]
MMKFYQIAKPQGKYSWYDIRETNDDTIDEYLRVENDFILTIKEFFDYHCTLPKMKYGHSRLAYNFTLYEYDDDAFDKFFL